MNKNKITTFIMHRVHIFILGIGGAMSLGGLFTLSQFDASRLNAFGPTAKLYFSSIKAGLITSTAILLLSFAAALFFRKTTRLIATRMESAYQSFSDTKKNLLILAVCLIFAFASHAGNIVNGYFNMDDFEVAALNRNTSLLQSFFIPHGNDHALPLFRVEMRTLDALFGQNPIPYNMLIFLMFALIPFFTYLSFKRLGIGIKSFAVFLVLFAGAAGWDDIISGFYIMSIYLQIIFFFSVALWAYLAWEQTHAKKYMLFFALSLAGALTADTSGIWVAPAMTLAMIYTYWLKKETTKTKAYIQNFFKENRVPLVVMSELIIAFVIFLLATFTIIHPHIFFNDIGTLSPNEQAKNLRLVPIVSNFFTFFASGVSLSLFVPQITKILTHPAVKETAQNYWPLLEIIILSANAILLWFTMKYAEAKEKKLLFLFMGMMFITISMIIVTRPNHETIPDFDYRYAGTTFYAYCVFLALSASVFLKTKKEYALKIIVPMVIIIFSAQQAFSFQSVRISEEAKMRKEAIQNLNKNLLSEIDRVSKEKKDGPLIVPNLNGGHIFEQTLAGFTLSYYALFFDRHMPVQFIQSASIPQDDRTHTVTSVSNLRASTSPEFKEALRKSEIIRSYYFSPRLMSYKFATGSSTVPSLQNTKKETVIQEKEIDPEKMHTVGFTLTTDNTPGNLELSFIFKNDFGWKGTTGKIRVDDFTPYEIEGSKRVYQIETDLLQLYAYALSEKISHLALLVPDTKNASVDEIYFK